MSLYIFDRLVKLRCSEISQYVLNHVRNLFNCSLIRDLPVPKFHENSPVTFRVIPFTKPTNETGKRRSTQHLSHQWRRIISSLCGVRYITEWKRFIFSTKPIDWLGRFRYI